MKNVFLGWAALSLLAINLLSCSDPCAGLENAEVGDAYFTLTYQDASGNNPLTSGAWRLDKVEVFIDSAAGNTEPDLYRVQPGYEGGTFGPFRYTQDAISPRTLQVNLPLIANQPRRLDYFIRKDTFGIDTLSLSYLLIQDECHFFWSEISYTLNGQLLTQFQNRPQADIVVTE